MISFFDTSTLPTDEMLEAMRTSRVGDDVYGQDPTVNELETLAAERCGMEAGVFMPSGTMANLVALMAHTDRGDEVVVERESHVFYHEAGGMAAVAGLMPLPVPGERGVLRPEAVEPWLRHHDQHYPRTSLLCVENPHNWAGGTITRPEIMVGLVELCRRRGLRLHVDGARIFNAAVALGVSVRELVAGADSVAFSLSKGLSAPVGSMLVGSREFVAKARRIRKMLGGGMRQAGVLAAAGIVALTKMVDRLADDHARARELAIRLARIPGILVDLDRIETNIVIADIGQTGIRSDDLQAALKQREIWLSAKPPHLIRLATHRHIGDQEVAIFLDVLRDVLEVRRQAVDKG